MIQFGHIIFLKWVELKPPPSLVFFFFAFFPDSFPGSVEGFPTQLQLKPNRLRSKGIPPLKDALINEPEDHLKACPRKRLCVFLGDENPMKRNDDLPMILITMMIFLCGLKVLIFGF